MVFVLIAVGLAMLVAGGEMLVRGAVALAKRFGMSPLLIGLTLVGFGTSAPELVTSINAALAGSPGIAVGNVVGSNIANILLILGVSALIFPVAVASGPFRRDGTALAIATVLCVLAVLAGQLTLWMGLGLVAALIAYIAIAWFQDRKAQAALAPEVLGAPATASTGPAGSLIEIALVVAGLASTIVGANLLVTGAIDLASSFGVPESVIGLTIVAVGTSLPELVTSVMAALRKHSDLAFGNIVGSNIYNIFGILGATAVIHPIAVPPEIARLDIWVMAAATAALFIVTITGWRIARWEGGVMVAAYAGYIGWLAMTTLG
ncbi:calcium/sodium antiporter [bacterium]|nr:calcium/sodium antiporter [bacterium]